MANTTIPSELIQADVALGGSPPTTTQSAGNNTTKLATTAFVTTAVSNLIASAPGTMDTLNEIAAALNDDPDFTTTVNNAIATKLPLGGGTMTGNITVNDNVEIQFGTGGDYKFDYNGSRLNVIGTGDLVADISGDFYFDADGGDLFFQDGGSAKGSISMANSDITLTASADDLILAAADNIHLICQGNESGIDITGNGAVSLYHDNDLTFQTTSNGVQVGRNNDGTTRLQLYGTTAAAHEIFFGNDGTNGTQDGAIRYFGEAHGTTANRRAMTFSTANAEQLRIDASGNLLVGVTSTTIPGVSNTTAGTSLRGDDGSFFSRTLGSSDTNFVMHINRSTDGNILGFAKAGNVVGSIGTVSGDVTIDGGSEHTGLRFEASDITPRHNGAAANNFVDLGTSGARFKDFHLSGAITQTVASGGGDYHNVNHTGNESWSWGARSGAGADDYLDVGIAGGTRVMSWHEDGKCGIGELAPSTSLHVSTGSNGTGLIDVARFENQGTTANDGARIQLTAGTSVRGAGIGCLGDALNSAHLVFHAGGNVERMRILSNGTTLFGVTAEPSGSVGGSGFIKDSLGRMNLVLATTNAGNIDVANFRNPNGTVGKINTNGSSTVYNTSSDARLKDVTGSARGLEVINELNPVSYNWKVDGKADEGLIAQEVLDIVPNAVTGSDEEQYYMDYSKLVVHLVAGMKEQQTQIEELKKEVKELKSNG